MSTQSQHVGDENLETDHQVEIVLICIQILPGPERRIWPEVTYKARIEILVLLAQLFESRLTLILD